MRGKDWTGAEHNELAERADDLLIHSHGRSRSCITFYNTYDRSDDRRLLTALRILHYALEQPFEGDSE